MADLDPPSNAWRAVASRSDVLESGFVEVLVGRSVVLLVSHADQIRAVQGLCPHQHARLAEGTLIDNALQCPRHLARFNLTDGTCTGGWYLEPLKRYPVRIDGDQISLPDPLVALG